MQSSDGVFIENVYWKCNVSFKKETEKIVLLQMKDLIHFIVKFRTKKICQHFYHLPVILLIGKPLNIAIGHQIYCVAMKEQIECLYFPGRK